MFFQTEIKDQSYTIRTNHKIHNLLGSCHPNDYGLANCSNFDINNATFFKRQNLDSLMATKLDFSEDLS